MGCITLPKMFQMFFFFLGGRYGMNTKVFFIGEERSDIIKEQLLRGDSFRLTPLMSSYVFVFQVRI